MISVCIPTYNGEKFIKEQLDSILPQLLDEDEVIISDDSSTDNTINIIKSYNDKRILIFENNNFKSPIYNLENALLKAKGDYIFLSDQDDIWLSNKVEIVMNNLRDYSCVISDAYVVNEKKEIICNSFFMINKTKYGKIYNVLKNGYLGCCMAFTKEIKDLSIPFPKKLPMHDIWIGNVAAFHKSVQFINEKLIYYRRHGLNLSSTSEKSNINIFKKLIYRLSILLNLTQRVFSKGNCK